MGLVFPWFGQNEIRALNALIYFKTSAVTSNIRQKALGTTGFQKQKLPQPALPKGYWLSLSGLHSPDYKTGGTPENTGYKGYQN